MMTDGDIFFSAVIVSENDCFDRWENETLDTFLETEK
jgi:hypothetical protein